MVEPTLAALLRARWLPGFGPATVVRSERKFVLVGEFNQDGNHEQ